MSLRPDRDYFMHEDITRFWNPSETTAQTAGGVASLIVGASGAALGASLGSGMHPGLGWQNTVGYVAAESGAVPVGVLTQDVAVVSDPDNYYRNFDKLEVLPGEKCCLVTDGWVVTNKIQGTPTAGATAYLAPSGLITASVPGVDYLTKVVGKFETAKDEKGFARVRINL